MCKGLRLMLTSKTGSETDRAIGGLNLDKERAENVDTPAGSRFFVLFPFRARGRDIAVNEPVYKDWVSLCSAVKLRGEYLTNGHP